MSHLTKSSKSEYRYIFVTVGLILLFLASCSQSSPTNSDNGNNDNDNNNPPSQCDEVNMQNPGKRLISRIENTRRAAESYLFKLNDEIPGFGGIYMDQQGRRVVLLKNMHKKVLATAVLNGKPKVHPVNVRSGIKGIQSNPSKSGNIVFKKANYTFSQIAGWRELATSFLLSNHKFDYVISTDADEKRNEVVIGINKQQWNKKNLDNVKEYLFNVLRVPQKAVLFEKEAVEVEDTDTSDDRFGTLDGGILERQRPIVGGIRITRKKGHTNHYCTLGFLGLYKHNDKKQKVFVTCSHCTEHPDHISDSKFYQGVSGKPADLIGDEVADGGFTASGCATPNSECWPCRWSDAAMIGIDDGVKAARGYIAKTTRNSKHWLNTGSRTIDRKDPVFTIVAVDKDIKEGMFVSKVGGDAGWVSGEVIKTCYDSRRSDRQIILMCQDKSKATATGGGDSGAPVFEILDPAKYNVPNPVALVGIHRASAARDQTDGYSAFSPIKGILKDFKGLTGLTVKPNNNN
jgi:hypothetical protein